MKIVIAGAGEVGSHVAKLLCGENQDIVVVDSNPDKISVLDANYNLMTVLGSPTSFKSLKEAGASNCDLFIAVTPYEDSNITACAIAKNMGARKTVARIDNYEYMELHHRDFFSRMGVDALIYPEYLAAKEIITALEHSWARNWFEIHGGELLVIGVKIRENARIVGMQLREVSMKEHVFHVSAIKRHHETIIPRGNEYMMSGDILYCTTTRDHIEQLREACGKKSVEIKSVVIVGGGRIAVRLANLAGNNYRIKIIDFDRERCLKLPERCPECVIVHGDGRDIDTLKEENVGESDAFIALTGSSETNILTSLTAKECGVLKTIAEVENIQFISEAESLNIGTIINKKLLASSAIFQILLDADSSSSTFMALADALVADLEAKEGSKITKGPVKDLRLPSGMTLGGLVRDGQGMLVGGNTQIRPGDHVVVFCLSGAIQKTEKLFN